ncbi:MAG: hypothetical protein HND44_11855 [Chloroflexi bacterium]|nr:hypothetical protein [Ardenticatenaceae bacterium]MBL1129176.1 hypothetical protein [Chloroflexota bacterium]NOG35252.1 hypothetical protein [Chloroflexota bacterium]GIK58461.1 MAG: hypothetical protein BroJett015_41240 [Chloroflexota bacterium]
MNKLKLLILILLMLSFLAGCEPEEQQGGGKLPDGGVELVADFVMSERFDESGGRIVYVENAPATESGEKQWCVNVRYINSQGLKTIPLLVRQQGEAWRLERNPERAVYEEYGCVWP